MSKSKILKKIIFAAFFLLCSLNLLNAQNQIQTSDKKGKIVIVVLDVSGSIRNQFPDIKKVIDKTIVQKRLSVGDYFVLIPFGDEALPMYSGQLLRDEDKNSISNTLSVMKADNNFTDIGSAIKTALNYIIDLKKNDYNLYEPLVLFITDGDITTSPKSNFYGQNVNQIFEDATIGNKFLYNGWYFVGIGKNLHDLPEIAQKSGRENYLLRIEDLNKLEFMLDDWISKIPESQPLEQGEILLENFALNSKKLKANGKSKILSSSKNLKFEIASTYQRTPVSLEFKDANAVFQTSDRNSVVPIKVNPEAGIINLPENARKISDAGFVPSQELKGNGILKIHFSALVNGLEQNFDESFEIEGKSASSLLFEKIFWPSLILVILVLIGIAVLIIRKFMPVKIVMEIVGQPSSKQKPVSMKVGKKTEFGSKPGLSFKLDGNQFAPVVGQIKRSGADKWQIVPRDANAFEEGTKSFDYKLGEKIKLKNRDEDSVTIRFKKR